MIYAIFGTHTGGRQKALKELASLGTITRYLYSEHAPDLESLIDATSLFGDTGVIVCVSFGEVASSKESLVNLLERMKTSSTLFIIDEPFGDMHLYNKITKVATKVYDAREEKVKDTSVFKLCDSFVARDKKQAWIDFMNVREKSEGEAIQGALWWKFQTVWQATREGRKTPFTLLECERIGGDLVKSTIFAHRGELDLMTELERVVVSL